MIDITYIMDTVWDRSSLYMMYWFMGILRSYYTIYNNNLISTINSTVTLY